MRSTNLQPGTLDARTRQIVLEDIVASWKQNLTTLRPPALWIREYALLPSDYVGEASLDSYGWPCNAWFLDANGLHERRSWDYQWFHIFQFVQPWCSLSHPVLTPPLWGRHRYEIGLVGFAPLEGQDSIYLEHIVGGTTGGADLLRINEQGALECVKPMVRF